MTTVDSNSYQVGEIVKNGDQACVATKDKLLQIGGIEYDTREDELKK
ncbi:MAG: hypothetical protein ABFS56_03220 [Pseudomonadota bacterium]